MKNYLKRLTGVSPTLNWVVGIAVGAYLAQLFLFFFAKDAQEQALMMQHLQFPVKFQDFIHQPWSLITYPIAHPASYVLPFIMNCLFIFMFGRIAVSLMGEEKFRSYVIAALLFNGIVTFLVAMLVVPNVGDWTNPTPEVLYANTHFFGLASLMTGVIALTITLAPRYPIRLVFLGNVPIVWVGLVLIVLRFVSISTFRSVPEMLSLGVGAALGIIHVLVLRRGTDLTAWVSRIFTWFRDRPAPRPVKISNTPKPTRKGPARKVKMTVAKSPAAVDPQEELDRILDKINDVGYEKLTRKEKEFLEKASKE